MEEDKKSPHAHYKSVADDLISLRILDMIEQGKKISQRKITNQTGLAAGLVHSYMRKVINKGWVKAKQVSARRWLYYLTPDGFMEKSNLTIKYFSVTLKNFRDAQNLLRNHVDICQQSGWSRLIVAGDNDLAEIAALNINSVNALKLVAVLSVLGDGVTVAGVKALKFDSVDEIEYDRILICDVKFLEWWASRGRSAGDERLIHLSIPQ